MFLKQILILMVLFALAAGCVGTVQEAAPPGSLKLDNPPSYFNFPGIITSRAVSHNKVELEFYPAPGSNIIYKLYVNNSTTPFPIDPDSLLTVNGGRLLYTVKDLVPDREYKFKLTAESTTSASISKNENEAFARTFDNVVANFDGVTKVSLVEGNRSGAIKVDWIAPTMSGPFTAGPYDPIRYEVKIISEIGGSVNINNPMYFGSDKREIPVPYPPANAGPLNNPSTLLIEGLAANTRYFVQVRAIHTLFEQSGGGGPITISKESNTRFLTIKTDPAGGLFDFRQDNVILSNAPGIDAFDKIDVFWQPGTGSFSNYRVFVRKYDGIGDATIDDKLTDSTMNSMNLSGNYHSVASSFTSKRVSSLESYSVYQVKVALCKTLSCPVLPSDPNAAIVSDLRTIQVKPTLAPFSGINTIEPPGQFSEKNVVNLKFDAPLVNAGFANELEFYCVDPADHSQMVKLSTAPLSGSGVAHCDGVFIDGTAPALSSYSAQKLKGLVTDGATEYCFAATPAILGFGVDVRLPIATRIVRCAYPEVLPPSIAQFPGLNNSCAITGTSGNVTWNLPSGGIYSGFKVFWKEKTSASKFSFPHAAANDAGYFNSGDLSASTLQYTATGLMPGKTYQIGVLATVEMDVPVPDLYSEYNLNIVECTIPLPIPTFQGFTRIFAVGPKMDGRTPNDSVTKSLPISGVNNSLIYEAIDENGVPYEVAMDSMSAPNLSANFAAPPGRDAGSSFAMGFDGAADGSGYAMSREGMVSLAWEDVLMNYPEANSIFSSNQPAAPAPRANRKWGYKVFRSSDNKLTWKELTATNGPVYSLNYTYYKRPGQPSTTSRMAFFTDYSVKALYEVHDAANAADVERARTYFYRIVPVFDGQNLNYNSGNHHIVKVTLPPPNMALVHRWMANRSRCLEIDKNPLIGLNYSCPYNGIGSNPRGIPHRVGETYLDQGGDLLVDRYELGCRYTRGEKTATPELSASNFALPISSKRHPDDENYFPLFKGFRTVAELEDLTTPFKGCMGRFSWSRGTQTADDYPAEFAPEYQRYLQGDCYGAHLDNIAIDSCTSTNYTAGYYNRVYINAPGAEINASAKDCSDPQNFNPTTVTKKYLGYFAPNFLMQSEFMAVFYNNRSTGLSAGERHPPLEGPTTGSLSGSRLLNPSWATTATSSSCSINLASIGSNGYMKPRWASINELGLKRIAFKGASEDLLQKTVDQITEVAASTTEPLTLYNGVDDGTPSTAEFKLPTATLRSSNRYRNTTKLAKIMTSNASKLPPIGKLAPEIADSLCSTYSVQTGIASDTGVFSPDSLPKKKRPLRRIESVASSAWPEAYSAATIQNIERSSSGGSCVNTYKNITGTNIGKGYRIGNRSVLSDLNDVPIVTGSSNYDRLMSYGDGYHSARCVSRYGVQDAVGNVAEWNSEKLYCDYSQDAINLGPVTGAWSGGSAAQNTGAGGPDFPFFNTNDERNNWSVLRNGTPTANDGSSFEIRFRNGDPAITNARPWVKISTDSGYCSPVDSNPLKRSGFENFFRDVTTDIWTSIRLPGGALNTSIVERVQEDQESINGFRNGDGRFLDFGPSGIGAPINSQNSLALTGPTAKSKYFNPIVGLPLKCENMSCNDPSLDTMQNDNTSITITDLEPNIVPDNDDEPSIKDFYIGNSGIGNTGVSDYSYDASGYSSTTVPFAGGTVNGLGPVLQAVLVDDPTTMGNPSLITKTFPTDFIPGQPFEYYRVVWAIERNARLAFSSGGGSNTATTGRYTASMGRAGYNVGHILGGETERSAQGVRCAILINQD